MLLLLNTGWAAVQGSNSKDNNYRLQMAEQLLNISHLRSLPDTWRKGLGPGRVEINETRGSELRQHYLKRTVG